MVAKKTIIALTFAAWPASTYISLFANKLAITAISISARR
jgi:hypothetical protein